MTNEVNKKTARRFFEDMGKENWRDTLSDIFAEDLKWWIPKGAAGDYPGEHQGKDNIVSMMSEAANGAFHPDTQKADVLLEVAGDNCVIMETVIVGDTTIGPRYENTYVFIFKFDESGKINELREHVDTHVARELFGNL
ncbi:SnoaL-like domain-containing protein [Pseudomaricurvus alkylphenolicus]|jgi:ketosteroid isomerase-like protein|uniref:nuclear transport factor 2 family protein n=1 Tax=Pseudomaricurvus alkylphenolicus TaxID=1306991 RepID=UPI00142294A5|nr:nuclear transport factor 2 family protein [Pseudomaricurvus alkylphenolicus]NIB38008.1 SnoaL-like domain-containing protein [Pseudomaricurvus alkylphenolicus]